MLGKKAETPEVGTEIQQVFFMMPYFVCQLSGKSIKAGGKADVRLTVVEHGIKVERPGYYSEVVAWTMIAGWKLTERLMETKLKIAPEAPMRAVASAPAPRATPPVKKTRPGPAASNKLPDPKPEPPKPSGPPKGRKTRGFGRKKS
jgi:hypothetical protein